MLAFLLAIATSFLPTSAIHQDQARRIPAICCRTPGGHYSGGHGSSHKGGHYSNPRTGDRYRSKGSVPRTALPRPRGTSPRPRVAPAPSPRPRVSKPQTAPRVAPRSPSPAPGARDRHRRLKRSKEAKRQFEKQSGHPSGWPGHVIDHKIPLACGGSDTPSNMQWQSVDEAKAKDKVERQGCQH
jgi:hypothetical protein